MVGVTKRKEGWQDEVGPVTKISATKAWVKRTDGEVRDFSAVGKVLVMVKKASEAAQASVESAGSASASSGSSVPALNVLQLMLDQSAAKRNAEEESNNIFCRFGIDQEDAEAFGE